MRFYLDEDVASAHLEGVLANAGHDIEVPGTIGRLGASDVAQLTHSIRESRIVISRNHGDFEELHDLLMVAGGHHPGILVVRRENNPRRDLRPHDILRAIGRMEAASLVFEDHLHVVNQWR
jgi:predicted nuclease of predicted toxin-antitoxin system